MGLLNTSYQELTFQVENSSGSSFVSVVATATNFDFTLAFPQTIKPGMILMEVSTLDRELQLDSLILTSNLECFRNSK